MDLSQGEGFDLVITAPNSGFREGHDVCQKGGYVSYFCKPSRGMVITINSRTLHYNELIVYGTSDSTVEHVKGQSDAQETIRRLTGLSLPINLHERLS